MTDLAQSPTHQHIDATPRALRTLAAGLIGGFALGVIARAWMRLISEDPEFTWAGTIFIVAGFTIFGFVQSIVAVARSRARRRWPLTMVRTLGVVAMLPLFVAAGAVMLPTVIGGGLALARTDWHRVVRGLCLAVAALPVAFVGKELVGAFGWSLQTLAGFVLMLAVYAAIIRATGPTFSAQLDGWRLSRRLMIFVPLAVAAPVATLILASIGL